MTFAEIKELLSDGFTPEQITLLTTSGAVPTPAPVSASGDDSPDNPLPAETPDALKETIPEPTPADPDPAPDPAPVAVPDKNADIMKAINDLKATIQAGNILRNSIETIDPDQALEKAMSEIIRPSFDKHE